jgi:hypothetical protein
MKLESADIDKDGDSEILLMLIKMKEVSFFAQCGFPWRTQWYEPQFGNAYIAR